ncbi:MAG: YhbD family protein [Coriobacteriia bacterium]|nr:YhbD family protein [Coriobacteriia bacterium]
MEQELISKKELLELTGISYGQLYRWKRERLLPEDWFNKRSSYTGQETFFPRAQILERINAIKELKDEYSLESIATILSPNAGSAIAVDQLKDLIKTDAAYLDLVIEKLHKGRGSEQGVDSESTFLTFSEVVFIGALGDLVTKGFLGAPQAAELALDSRSIAQEWKGEVMDCNLLKTLPEESPTTSWHLALFKQGFAPLFSKRITVVAQLPLDVTSAGIKRALQEHCAPSQQVY